VLSDKGIGRLWEDATIGLSRDYRDEVLDVICKLVEDRMMWPRRVLRNGKWMLPTTPEEKLTVVLNELGIDLVTFKERLTRLTQREEGERE
jgi:hypothetical protein